MTGAVNEARLFRSAFFINKKKIIDPASLGANNLRYMAQQPVGSSTSLPLARRINLLVTLVAPVARRPGTSLVVALVNLRIGITKLDGNVPDQLVLETNGLHAGDGLDDGGLSVGDVADGTNVYGRLPGDNLWGQGREGVDVEILGIRLGR